MLESPIRDYGHLPGWASLITRLLAELESVTGPYRFRVSEIRERYGALLVEAEPVDAAPPEIIAAAEKLVAAAEDQSEFYCFDCGAPAMNHEWNMHWILPCCPKHARERARNATERYNGPGWRLTKDFHIVDEAGVPLTSAKIRELDLAATRHERRTDRAVVIEPLAADWRAARWMSTWHDHTAISSRQG